VGTRVGGLVGSIIPVVGTAAGSFVGGAAGNIVGGVIGSLVPKRQ